jgi:hypothetical protein
MTSVSKSICRIFVVAIGLGGFPLTFEVGQQRAAAEEPKAQKTKRDAKKKKPKKLRGINAGVITTKPRDDEVIYCPGDPGCP